MDRVMEEHPQPDYPLPDGVRYGTRKDITGTGLCGYVQTTLAQLEATLGPPMLGSVDDKMGHIWVLWIDGQLASIYDYKWRPNSRDQLCQWHIGGSSAVHAVAAVGRVLDAPCTVYGRSGSAGRAIQKHVQDLLNDQEGS